MKLSTILGLTAIVAVASAAVPLDRETRFFKKVTRFVSSTAGKATGAVGDFVEDSADAVGDFAGDAVDAVGDFADDAVDTVGDAAKTAVKGVTGISKKAYREAYSAAKKSFNAVKDLAEDVDFDQAVDVLVGLIDSELTKSLCIFSCQAAAVSIFGPGGVPYAAVGCPTLCSAASGWMRSFAIKHITTQGPGKDE
ncbi:hypothetical protein PoB_005633100 [Plakobranchus ocellatus]|uniref:Uncharacterized protein n=1 Tax=Plakobranchus ocellatus TaxID=259542 RepID=A0AAV4CAR8_9GAST|nr:hypothetical protein PoB_005633100 [Plakobranchus ocellatus]